MADSIEVLLGQIDGKLDQALAAFKEHREEDTRRFTAVFEALKSHEADINQAKGAKNAILLLRLLPRFQCGFLERMPRATK